ncbi:MAG: hypothetical protein ACLQU3_22835 [Limisphaerales bacterium]
MDVEQQALELAEIRRRASEALTSGDIDTYLELIVPRATAIERLQNALLESAVHVVKDPGTSRLLAEIELSEIEDMDQAGMRLLYSWLAPRDYALALSRVNALISPISVPETLRQVVEEARQCYAFQQPNAVYSLSRTILETAVNDICVRIGRMPNHDLRKWSFCCRLGFLLSGPRHTQALDHYHLLCRLVHGGTTVTSGDALTALAETLGYVSHLYAVHCHAMRGRP